jgi:pyrroline-5-carboxylate reductase
MTVVLVGCGRMGSALAGGMVRSGRVAGERLVLLDADTQKAEALADELGALTELSQAGEGRKLWLVAVKPKVVASALAGLSDEIAADDMIVSVAAGLSLVKLRSFVGEGPAIVRSMPNTPALVGKGVTGIMADGDADTGAAREMFESVGHVVELKREENFDALTAVSGSGPAYIFTAIEALADGGVKMGLSREVARELATQTVAGAAALVADDPSVHTAELKDRVASPGGTTITALAALEEHGFRHALISAVEAAATRSRQMGED